MWIAGGLVGGFSILNAVGSYKCAFYHLTDREKFDEMMSWPPHTRLTEDDLPSMKSWLENCGIKSQLRICEGYNENSRIKSIGANLFGQSDCAIFIGKGLREADPDACCWGVKQHVSLIKQNARMTILCISSVCAIATAVFGTCFLPVLPAVVLTLGVATAAFFLLGKRYTDKALDFANAQSTDNELKGARRFYKALQNTNQGDFTKEIIKIEKAIKERRLGVDDSNDIALLGELEKHFSTFEENRDQAYRDYRAKLKPKIPRTPAPI